MRPDRRHPASQVPASDPLERFGPPARLCERRAGAIGQPDRPELTERGEEVLESIRERQLPGRPDKPSVQAERDPEPVGILG